MSDYLVVYEYGIGVVWGYVCVGLVVDIIDVVLEFDVLDGVLFWLIIEDLKVM